MIIENKFGNKIEIKTVHRGVWPESSQSALKIF